MSHRARITVALAVAGTAAISGRAHAGALTGEVYSKLPLTFEKNEGQTDSRVRFLSRGSGYTAFLTPTEAVMTLSGASGHSALHMRVAGANRNPRVQGEELAPGRSNYFIGNDPRNHHTNVASYRKVRYANVYPGVDLVYYGTQRRLEYDFIVAAGADPSRIGLDLDGAKGIGVNAAGDLVVRADGGSVKWLKPVVYQNVNGRRQAVAGSYKLTGRNGVGFQLDAYDHTKPLVIDPVLSYASYLGGSGTDIGRAIAVDASGNVYVTGYTTSTNFPGATGSTIQGANGGGTDVYVTKINAAGTAVVYSTYLGGSPSEQGRGIAVDAAGNAYVTGYAGTGFPTLNPFQAGFGGGSNDAFVTKINAAGNALVFSSYLGGGATDQGQAIALDASNNIYVTGNAGAGFPLASPIQATFGGGTGTASDAFVTKISADGTSKVYSTYLGGVTNDAGNGIAVDPDGNAYVTGSTGGGFTTTTGAVQTTYASGTTDAFVVKLNAAGSARAYSTYLGGSGNDIGLAVAVDAAGSAYVTGNTNSGDFPGAAASPIQHIIGGGNDAFVTKVDATGATLDYSTYLGGSGNDIGQGIAVDAIGNAYVTGFAAAGFPLVSPLQASFGGGADDIFITKVNAAGTALGYSTYLGGAGADIGQGVAVDTSGNAYVFGYTTGAITTANALQPGTGGGTDAFVVRLSETATQIPARFGAGSLVATQTRPVVDFGDNQNELDQLYAFSDGSNLHVGLTGNVADGNGIVILLDTGTGGANPFSYTNGDASGRITGLNNDVFDTGFNPTYALDTNTSSGTVYVDLYNLLANSGAGSHTYLGSSTVGTNVGVLNDGVSPGTGFVALNLTNTAGVTSTAAVDANGTPLAATATTGLELTIPLSQIGSPTGSIKIAALLISSGGYLSNQVLPGFPDTFGDIGSNNYPSYVARFDNYAGAQYATVGLNTTAHDVSRTAVAWSYNPVALTGDGGVDAHPPVTSSVTVNNGKAYVVDANGNLTALNVASSGTATLAAGFGTGGRVTLDAPVTGRVSLRSNASGTLRLYAATTAGTIYALDAETGANLVSIKPLGDGVAATSSSTPAVILEGGTPSVFAGVKNTSTGRAYLVKVSDAGTPAVLGTFDVGSDVMSSPSLIAAGTRVQIGASNDSGGGTVYTISPDLTTVFNAVTTANPVVASPTLSRDSTAFFVGDNHTSFYSFNASNANLIWQSGVGGVPGITGGVTGAAFVDYLAPSDVVYFGTLDGELDARNLDGSNAAGYPAAPFGNVAVVGGVTLLKPTITSATGNLYVPTANGVYYVPSGNPATYRRFPVSAQFGSTSAAGRAPGSILAGAANNGNVYGFTVQP